ncbi:hypothetical protein H311_05063, partial [Anncaliia algerae PRA109]
IFRKLKNKIKFTRKRLCLIPQERNVAEKMDYRAFYATEISRISDCNLVLLNESGFNEHTRRVYGYSPINTKAYLTVPGIKNLNRSLLYMIGVRYL